MAIHIYMATDHTARVFNYRGEAAPGDDPEAFKRLMELRGLEVLLREKGEPEPPGAHWRGIPRRNLFPLPEVK